jgi:hypothetical protein
MATGAQNGTGRYLLIMTPAAEFSIGYFCHRDIIGPRSHLEFQLFVTDVAAIMDPVEGM